MAGIDPISLALQGVGTAAQIGLGAFQYFNAIKQAKQNLRPTYQINPEFQQNLDILKNTMGLPQSALDMYYRNIGQNTNQGINAILASGGNANNISSLVGGQNSEFEKVLIQDALQKKQDITGILGANLQLAGEKDKAFQLNQLDPFKDKAEAIAGEKDAGLRNLFGAFNSIAGIGANAATEKLSSNDTGTTKPIFGTPSTTATGTPTSGVDYMAIWKQLNPNTTTSNLNLGQNNFQYGLPNYSMFGNLFGGNQPSNSFNPMDYSFLFKNNLF